MSYRADAEDLGLQLQGEHAGLCYLERDGVSGRVQSTRARPLVQQRGGRVLDGAHPLQLLPAREALGAGAQLPAAPRQLHLPDGPRHVQVLLRRGPVQPHLPARSAPLTA
eukprot:1441065-Rhodomonas_salina.2